MHPDAKTRASEIVEALMRGNIFDLLPQATKGYAPRACSECRTRFEPAPTNPKQRTCCNDCQRQRQARQAKARDTRRNRREEASRRPVGYRGI